MPVDVKIIVTDAPPLITLAAAQRLDRETGRDPPTPDIWSQHDPEIRDAVRAAIERAHRGRLLGNDRS